MKQIKQGRLGRVARKLNSSNIRREGKEVVLQKFRTGRYRTQQTETMAEQMVTSSRANSGV
jgi:hypothetical protein